MRSPISYFNKRGTQPSRGVPRRTWLPSPNWLRELASDPQRTQRQIRTRPPANPLGGQAKLIGLCLSRDEHDILSDSLAMVDRWFDAIYVLEGSTPGPERDASLNRYRAHPVIAEVLFDEAVPPAARNRDGCRQVLLEAARRDHGVDNWIAILHGDEILQQDPRLLLSMVNPTMAPSVRVRVAHHFLHTEAEPHWDSLADASLRQRVDTVMWPGVPETRFFFDRGERNYRPDQHSQVVPASLRVGPLVEGYVIHQFNYRSPEQARSRSIDRLERGWQAQHYRHLRDGPSFIDTLDQFDSDGPLYEHLDLEPPTVRRSSSAVPWVDPTGEQLALSPHDALRSLAERAERELGDPALSRWLNKELAPLLFRTGNQRALPTRELLQLRRSTPGLHPARPGYDAALSYLWRGLKSRHLSGDERLRLASEFIAGLLDGPTNALGASSPKNLAAGPPTAR